MKSLINHPARLAALACSSLFLAACDVDKVEEGSMPNVDIDGDAGKLPKVEVTEEGELPSVDVDVEGEVKLPKFDVDGPDIDVGSKKVEVEVPTIDVDLPDDEPEGNGDEAPSDARE